MIVPARPTFTSLVLVIIFFVSFRAASAEFQNVSEEMNLSGGGKAAFADFDGDGWVDVYNGKLHRNLQGKRFQWVEQSGLPGGEGIWGDYDNDGDVDLFIYSGVCALFQNGGMGKFSKVDLPKLPETGSRGAVWADLNNDGFLDLYIGGYEVWQQRVHPDVILFNNKNGSFREQWQSPKDACYSARGVTAADLNEDGAVDVYVSNYRLQPNQLWRNDGKGKLSDVAKKVGAAGIADGGEIVYTGGIRYQVCGHTIGSALGDLDDDGQIDIFVGNFSHPRAGQDHPQFLQNLGSKAAHRFADRSANAGLGWQESFASAALGDYDNDGDLDLYFTTVYGVGSGGIHNYPVLYRNKGNWKFEDVTMAEGLSKLGSTYQAAWADIDNDGDLDLFTDGKILRNGRQPGKAWLQVVLEGDGEHVNRSAIGAIARVAHDERQLTRHVEAGTGEGNQNDLRLHWGLGERAAPVTMTIAWPGGTEQVVTGLEVGKLHRIAFKAKQ